MTEPVPQNLKYAIGMVWIALITAIIVTVIDWKIKEDIRRMADAFFKIYPSPPDVVSEAQNVREKREEKPPIVDRYIPGDYVPRSPDLDSDSGVETGDVANETESVDNQPSEADWERWTETLAESESGGSENS